MQTTGREFAEYLTMAQRAEHAAAKFAPGSVCHESWHTIAEGYRRLAKATPADERFEQSIAIYPE